MSRYIARHYAAATAPEAIERFTTSWLLPPSILFLWRAFICVYAFVVLFTIIGYENRHGDSSDVGHSFSYFTVLGYWGLAFYYGVAAAHTGTYWIKGKSWLQSWPSGLQWAHSCFYSSVTTFPFVVTIVFWTLLAGNAFRTQFSTWSNISEHALNTVFALSEVVIPRTRPSPWINLVVVIVLLALYLALAEVTYATQGWYVYSFLDPSWHGNGIVAAACIGILIGTAIVFIVVRYLVLLRQWVTESVLGMEGLLSRKAFRSGDVTLGEGGLDDQVPMQSMANKGAYQDMRCYENPV